MESSSAVLVLVLLLLPLAGALAAVASSGRALRIVVPAVALAELGAWVLLVCNWSGSALLVGLDVAWIDALGIRLVVALDEAGLSVAGLVVIVVAASLGATRRKGDDAKQVAVSLLLAEFGMIGAISAWDLLQFIMFWEFSLLPFFFLVEPGISRRGVSAATRMLVTSVSTSVLLWIGVLWIVGEAGRPLSFDLRVLADRLSGSGLAGKALLLLPAFLMRMAVFPLHTWLPHVVARVNTSASVLLLGAMVPMGAYGIYHVVLGIAPLDRQVLSTWLLRMGVVTSIAAAVSALVQRDLKRLLAYVVMSWSGMGLCGLAVASTSAVVWELEFSAGIAAAALALFVGVVCAARGSQWITDIGGLWRSHPFFSGLAFAAVATLASMPGTMGFVAVVELIDALAQHPLEVCLAAGGLVVAGLAMLWAYRFVLGGSHLPALWSEQRWPLRRQVLVIFLLAVLMVAGGVFPGLGGLVASGAVH